MSHYEDLDEENIIWWQLINWLMSFRIHKIDICEMKWILVKEEDSIGHPTKPMGHWGQSIVVSPSPR